MEEVGTVQVQAASGTGMAGVVTLKLGPEEEEEVARGAAAAAAAAREEMAEAASALGLAVVLAVCRVAVVQVGMARMEAAANGSLGGPVRVLVEKQGACGFMHF